MYVIKRDGAHEPVAFDKISARIEKLCYGLDRSYIDVGVIAQKVVAGVHTGVRTAQLDDLACETAAYMTTQHPDYARLAARIAVSNLHKMTDKSFAATMRKLNGYVDPKTGKPAALVSDEVLEIVEEHAATIDGWIVYDRDFDYDFFGFKTLERWLGGNDALFLWRDRAAPFVVLPLHVWLEIVGRSTRADADTDAARTERRRSIEQGPLPPSDAIARSAA
jgi:hypothetical protein